MRKIKNVIVSAFLLFAILFNLSGCFMRVAATNLMDGISAERVGTFEDMDNGNIGFTNFAVRLLKSTNSSSEGNVLISPLSVLCALAMTANGADGETLAEMEDMFGMDMQALNLYLYTYLNSLPYGENYKLSVANSIWFKDDNSFVVNGDFLQTNANYYGADIYKAAFDSRTLKDINNWVKQETDKMIPEILDRIPEDALMYLVNALAFEAEWAKIYEKYQVSNGVFTKEDGEKIDVKFMYSDESKYIYDENATGFIKYYKGGKYAFAALLPNEGISVSQYIDSLDAQSLNEMLSNSERATVMAAIPKFENEFSVEMADILRSMGMTLAFDESLADFGRLGNFSTGNLYISRVIHKTYISVAEKGTRAGAATVVEVKNESAINMGEPKKVYLDRPFVYMIIDTENNVPFFIGTVMEIN